MRAELAKYNGKRRKFKAVFEKYGQKSFQNHLKITLLLVDVVDVVSNQVVTDHLWFTEGKQFHSLGLKQGDRVTFTARVDTYEKGYIRNEWDMKETDYHLVFPTNLTKLQIEQGQTTLNL
jgi:hypothetical protein